MTLTSPPSSATAEDVAGRLLTAALGAMTTLGVYVGERLGLYRALADAPATAGELAERAGLHPRYAREWLEMQAADGLLEVDDVAAAAADRRYSLAGAVAEVMLDHDSLNYLGALPRIIAAAAGRLPELQQAYRSGGGVSWDEFGDDAREAQEELNRPWLNRALPAALRELPELDTLLRSPGTRVADIGSGAGWSSIGLARAYPHLTVVGYDVDEPSVVTARRNATGAAVAERVSFVVADAAQLAADGPFDLVLACECLHDMAHPVETLSAARNALSPNGSVVVMDEAVGDSFTAPADELDRLMYGYSMFICLPDGMSSPGSAATGTVMRREVLERYAADAGFTSVEVLPIEDFNTWRFYQLR